jgi:hypothetical protein
MMLTARLHPLKPKKGGELYSVIFHGKLLVERSSEPECDAARALLAKGITGKLTMLDGKTGRPRTVIDIERAALLCVKEGPLRFAPYESRPDRSPTAETDEAEGKRIEPVCFVHMWNRWALPNTGAKDAR